MQTRQYSYHQYLWLAGTLKWTLDIYWICLAPYLNASISIKKTGCYCGLHQVASQLSFRNMSSARIALQRLSWEKSFILYLVNSAELSHTCNSLAEPEPFSPPSSRFDIQWPASQLPIMFHSLNPLRTVKPKKTHSEIEANLLKSISDQANASLTTVSVIVHSHLLWLTQSSPLS